MYYVLFLVVVLCFLSLIAWRDAASVAKRAVKFDEERRPRR